ncbi:CD99 antigen-like protein 2 isoform X2 [Cynocephalus volans]|uniref:CD99 antigen-like protein 2 isoform X2 n=1 Tax=Cynocephalus volans TaxID=110931 RepID=UPI002FC86B87
MVAWRSAFLVCLAFSLATLVQRGSGDFGDNFHLEDALRETSSVKQKWDRVTTTTTRRPGTTRAPAYPAGDGRYGSSDDTESGATVETGTIAGVASALAMALIGAVSSYISYQQRKFCFSIQQSLNADYVKGENLEAVVCEEPQVKYSSLQTQSAEPPPPELPRI